MYTCIQLMVSDEITDINIVDKILESVSKNLLKRYTTVFVHTSIHTIRHLDICNDRYIPNSHIAYFRASFDQYKSCKYLVVITHNDLEFCSDMLSKFSEENTRIVYV